MPDQDIFDDNKVETKEDVAVDNAAAPVSNDDPTADLLKTIVNENGEPKYKTAEEALKATAHAQDHIKNLEAELAELRNKGNASDKLDELLEAVQSQSKGSGQGADEGASTMKPEDVLKIVQEHLKDSKAAETRENNISTVTKVFRDRYGKDASEKLYGKAEDLGFTKDEINRMIATNPKAALNTLGEAQPKNKATDPVGGQGSVATANFQGSPKQAPKSIMGPTTSKSLTDAWKESQQRTLERLGFSDK